MKPADDVEKFVNNAGIDTNPKMDQTVLDKVLTAHKKAEHAPNLGSIIMKSPITKIAAALVLIAGICITSLSGKSAWAQVIEAFSRATDVHIVKENIMANGLSIRANEAWIKNQRLFRAEAQDWQVVDNGRNVLTLYKNDGIAHIRESFTPYWDYTPLILKVFRDSQSRAGINVRKLPEECTAAVDVYEIDCRDYSQGKAWVDPTTNLPFKISGREIGYDGQQKDFELSFDYQVIPDEIFSVSIPPDYRELPRITGSEDRTERNEALSGAVVDEQVNPIANARVFASYAHQGRTDESGNFSLLVSPIDGSGSLGTADFPMFVWAYRDVDPYHVAWTLIRHPEADEFRTLSYRMLRPTIDAGQEQEQTDEHLRVEETHQGVKLVIKDDNDLSQSIPGNPGELYHDAEGALRVRDIILVMGQANVISGRVTDADGRLIANATVRLEQMEIQLGVNTITISELDREWKAAAFAMTDSRGHYSLNNLPISWHKIHIKALARGYSSNEQEFENNGQNIVQGCDLQLVEGASDDAPEARDDYRVIGRPSRPDSSKATGLRRSGQSPESTHYADVVADGYPVKGGGNVVTEVFPANLCNNLVLYYSFETVDDRTGAIDISGRNNHGQNQKVRHAQDGTLGGVMSFDGDNDYLIVPDIALEHFTFSAWVMSEAEHVNNRLIFVLTDGARCWTLQGNSGEGVSMDIPDIGEINEYDWQLAPEAWTHVTVTYDEQTFSIYRNGTLTETGNISTEPIAGTVYIGGNAPDQEDSWAGLLDEVALFDRALTPEEVMQLFAMTGAAVQDK